MKFYQNPSGGSRVFPCGRTDGQDAILRTRVKNVAERCATPSPYKGLLLTDAVSVIPIKDFV
jgi:hypothetical protein